MKTIGWVLFVLGGLSCLGALTAGHSIFGPVFFIAIGLMLINKSNNNKKRLKIWHFSDYSTARKIKVISYINDEIKSKLPSTHIGFGTFDRNATNDKSQTINSHRINFD